jgi:hypothetical protein
VFCAVLVAFDAHEHFRAPLETMVFEDVAAHSGIAGNRGLPLEVVSGHSSYDFLGRWEIGRIFGRNDRRRRKQKQNSKYEATVHR